MRALRYAWRIPWLLVHVFLGALIALFCLNPLTLRLVDAPALRGRVIPWWTRGMLRVFNIQTHCIGRITDGPVLFAANHIAWLDIEVLHGQRLMAFIAKAEIRRWPLVGWMAAQAGTIFHKRASGYSLLTVSESMTQRLRDGFAVGLFPQGGVSDSGSIETFHASLFQCAIDAGVPVQPVALRYVEADGTINTSTPFTGGEYFVTNVFRILGQKGTTAELYFGKPIDPRGLDRRELARRAEYAVRRALGQAVS